MSVDSFIFLHYPQPWKKSWTAADDKRNKREFSSPMILCPKLSSLRQCEVMTLASNVICLMNVNIWKQSPSETQTSVTLKQMCHKHFPSIVLLSDESSYHYFLYTFIRESFALNQRKPWLDSQHTITGTWVPRAQLPNCPSSSLSNALHFQIHT